MLIYIVIFVLCIILFILSTTPLGLDACITVRIVAAPSAPYDTTGSWQLCSSIPPIANMIGGFDNAVEVDFNIELTLVDASSSSVFQLNI